MSKARPNRYERRCQERASARTRIEKLEAANAELLEALMAVADQLESFNGISAGGVRVLFSAADKRALKQADAAIAHATGD